MKTNYRILNSDMTIKYAGTGLYSWFTLEYAREIVDYQKGEMIYEYNMTSMERMYEVF